MYNVIGFIFTFFHRQTKLNVTADPCAQFDAYSVAILHADRFSTLTDILCSGLFINSNDIANIRTRGRHG